MAILSNSALLSEITVTAQNTAQQIYAAGQRRSKRGSNKKIAWSNESGGGVVAMSAGQSKLGYDCDVLIFDDPLDEHGAYDRTVRDAVDAAIAHYTARAGRPGGLPARRSRRYRADAQQRGRSKFHLCTDDDANDKFNRLGRFGRSDSGNNDAATHRLVERRERYQR